MVKFYIPIKLPSIANLGGKLRAKIKMKKSQREATWVCMLGLDLPKLPVIVTITRIGPRKLDDDNLAAACKYVRDQIAAIYGVDDGSDQYTWKYVQRISSYSSTVGSLGGPVYGVEVEIETRKASDDSLDTTRSQVEGLH